MKKQERKLLCEKYKNLDISQLTIMHQILFMKYICGLESQREIAVILKKSQQCINYQCNKLIKQLEYLYTHMNDNMVNHD